jgi:hypothetical protein
MSFADFSPSVAPIWIPGTKVPACGDSIGIPIGCAWMARAPVDQKKISEILSLPKKFQLRRLRELRYRGMKKGVIC